MSKTHTILTAQGHGFYGCATVTVALPPHEVIAQLWDRSMMGGADDTSVHFDDLDTGVAITACSPSVVVPQPTVLFDSGNAEDDVKALRRVLDAIAGPLTVILELHRKEDREGTAWCLRPVAVEGRTRTGQIALLGSRDSEKFFAAASLEDTYFYNDNPVVFGYPMQEIRIGTTSFECATLMTMVEGEDRVGAGLSCTGDLQELFFSLTD